MGVRDLPGGAGSGSRTISGRSNHRRPRGPSCHGVRMTGVTTANLDRGRGLDIKTTGGPSPLRGPAAA